jgi:hypothetical protein
MAEGVQHLEKFRSLGHGLPQFTESLCGVFPQNRVSSLPDDRALGGRDRPIELGDRPMKFDTEVVSLAAIRLSGENPMFQHSVEVS